MPDPTYFVEALASTIDATTALCADFTEQQWAAPTGCPGWSVKDHVAHLAGLEAVLSGQPEPDHELVGEFPHLRDDTGRYMERHVDFRRGRSGAEVLAEFKEVWTARLAYLRSLGADGLQADAPGPMGSRGPLARALPIRVFDCWAHEQDIRRAVGKRGGLDSDAAAVSLTTCKRFAPSAVAGVVPDAAVVAFQLDGPNGGEFASSYADGKPTPLEDLPAEPTVTLATSDEMFAYLCCGRSDAAPGEVKLSGDRVLGEAIVGALGFTP